MRKHSITRQDASKCRKYKITFLIMLVASFILVGCSSEEGIRASEDEKEVIKSSASLDVENVWESVPLQETQEIPTIESFNNVEFEGVKITQDTPAFGNNPLNLKSGFPGLVCSGNGLIYYVNCGRDNNLYRTDGMKTEQILGEVVTSLNYWEQSLYFILHEDGNIRGMGPVCRYDLQEKQIEVLIDAVARYCCVTGDGIYYTQGTSYETDWGTVTGETLYFYDFADETSTELAGNRWNQYGNYSIRTVVREDGSFEEGLQNLDTEEFVPMFFENTNSFLIQEGIGDGVLYGIMNTQDSLVCLNLSNGEYCSIPVEQTDGGYLCDYTMWNGKLYMSLASADAVRGKMAVLEEDRGSVKRIPTQSKMGNYSMEDIQQGNYEEQSDYSYQELYVAEDQLFVLAHYTDSSRDSLEDGLLLLKLVEGENGFVEVEFETDNSQE